MKMCKKGTNYLEWILILLIIAQIFFFFIPIYEFSAGVAYIKFIEFTLGLYSLAFGVNYGIQNIAGNTMWLTMLVLPVVSLLIVVCARKNRIIRYGLPAAISVVELIGVKLLSAGLDTKAQTILMTIRSSEIMQALVYRFGVGSADEMMSYIFANAGGTNLCYIYGFILIASIAVAVALIVFNRGSLQSDMNEIIQTANNSAAKMQGVINAYSNTKTCQSCGAVISGDAEFCSKCGTKYVAPAERICPSCGAIITGDDMFCQKCGAKYEPGTNMTDDAPENDNLAADANICPNCGGLVRKGAKFCIKCGGAMDDV